jgi:hypothetical protein
VGHLMAQTVQLKEGGSIALDDDPHPDKCPICHSGITPRVVYSALGKGSFLKEMRVSSIAVPKKSAASFSSDISKNPLRMNRIDWLLHDRHCLSRPQYPVLFGKFQSRSV